MDGRRVLRMRVRADRNRMRWVVDSGPVTRIGASLAVAMTAAALLAAAGCGGGSSSSSQGPAEPGTQPASTPTASGDTAEFCKRARAELEDVTTQLQPLSDATASPETIKKKLQAVERGYVRVLAIAPADIRPDLDTLLKAVRSLNQSYADNNYDPAAAIAALVPLLNDQKLTQASGHLGAWAAANC